MTSGRENVPNGPLNATNGPASGRARRGPGLPRRNPTASAWERFAAGENVTDEGVRPEILASWYRCRDEYAVNPLSEQAPPAADTDWQPSLEEEVVLAELVRIAMSVEADVRSSGALVAVTDGGGRLLARWGAGGVMSRATDQNLAPRASWSERGSGTNGMGTALAVGGTTRVTRWEHWCAGFHDWSCAAIAIRDPVTMQPLGVLDVSSWRTSLPGDVIARLKRAVRGIESELHARAELAYSELAERFEQERLDVTGVLAAVDNGGRVVLANPEARCLLGLSESELSMADPLLRPHLEPPELRRLAIQAAARARQEASWVGSAEVHLPSVDTALVVTFRPVIANGRVLGVLVDSRAFEGELMNAKARVSSPRHPLVGIRANRLVLVSADEIRFAEADGNIVWLNTERGRLRSAERGLGQLEERLRDHEFLRVHRHYLVNPKQVREVAPSFKGRFWLLVEGAEGELIPVSRRRAPAVRRALGL